MRDPACGYTLVDDNNEEYPCDAPAPSWRWYQDVEHEDCLSPACERHENAGGIRMAEMADEIERLRAEHDQWKALWRDSVVAAAGGKKSPTPRSWAMSEEHKMIREEAVRYDRGEKTLTLGPYRLPGEAREVALRPELEGMNPRVVSRHVTKWEER